ncbi:MAG: class I SAM-dependent methyltransferase, partial [Legionellales bacterium]|nr:class I SAM-dependent methyltransferase [Legionellales bacterium]
NGGCAHAISKNYDCQVTAVDISSHDMWEKRRNSNLEFDEMDLGKYSIVHLGIFDIIFSMLLFEHVEHPYAILKAIRKLIKNTGKFYLRTNLHRSSIASHLNHYVYFPWCHLLFSDEVIKQYFISKGLSPRVPTWVNTLTVSHYLFYFNKLGFKVDDIKYSKMHIDKIFYEAFKDKLSKYPRFDLETNFFDAVLSL